MVLNVMCYFFSETRCIRHSHGPTYNPTVNTGLCNLFWPGDWYL